MEEDGLKCCRDCEEGSNYGLVKESIKAFNQYLKEARVR